MSVLGTHQVHMLVEVDEEMCSSQLPVEVDEEMCSSQLPYAI